MQSDVSGRILMIRATKKIIVKSVRHFYEVRVKNKCPTTPVVLVRAKMPCELSVKTHKKSIPQQTRKSTTIPRPPFESSQRREFKYAMSTFVHFIFDLFFKIIFQIVSEQKRHGKFGFTSLNILVQRSQTLLRCLGLSGN